VFGFKQRVSLEDEAGMCVTPGVFRPSSYQTDKEILEKESARQRGLEVKYMRS